MRRFQLDGNGAKQEAALTGSCVATMALRDQLVGKEKDQNLLIL